MPNSCADDSATPPLRNPKVAVFLSLFLTPFFGAWLHMKKWQALRSPEQAGSAKRWAIAGAAFYLVIVPIFILYPERLSGTASLLSNVANYGLLFAWYAVSAVDQIQHVKYVYDDNYPRRSWGKPIFYYLLVFALIIAVMFVHDMLAGYAPGI